MSSELTQLLSLRHIKRLALEQTKKVLVVLKKDNSWTRLPDEEFPSLARHLLENGEMLAISLEDNYAVMGDESYTYYLTLKKDTNVGDNQGEKR